jgi:ribosome-associated toxin RatA of RatAB toxin-antitoxin module
MQRGADSPRVGPHTMKDLAATASGTTPADPETAFALLTDLPGYPGWYPSGVRDVSILERDDQTDAATKVKATLHASVGPINRDFKLHLRVVTRTAELVELTRLPKEPRDREEMQVSWRLAPAGAPAGGTTITIAVTARLSIPPLVPVGGVADSMAKGFLHAALQQLG